MGVGGLVPSQRLADFRRLRRSAQAPFQTPRGRVQTFSGETRSIFITGARAGSRRSYRGCGCASAAGDRVMACLQTPEALLLSHGTAH